MSARLLRVGRRLGAAAACAAAAGSAARTAHAQSLADQLSHALADEERQRAFERLQATMPERKKRSEHWYREWLEQQVAEHPPAMSKDGWTQLTVWSVIPQSANCN